MARQSFCKVQTDRGSNKKPSRRSIRRVETSRNINPSPSRKPISSKSNEECYRQFRSRTIQKHEGKVEISFWCAWCMKEKSVAHIKKMSGDNVFRSVLAIVDKAERIDSSTTGASTQKRFRCAQELTCCKCLSIPLGSSTIVPLRTVTSRSISTCSSTL